MFLILSVLIGISAVTILLAGSLSLLRGPNRRENQWFFWLSLSLALWVPVNFADSNILNARFTPLLVKIDFAVAIIIAWTFLFFVMALIRNLQMRKLELLPTNENYRLFKLSTIFINLILILTIVSNSLIHVSVSNQSLTVKNSLFMYLYVAVLVAYFSYALILLRLAYSRATISSRGGINIIGLGFTVAATANILTNVVFPIFIHDRAVVKQLNIIGYLGIVGLIASLYIAITSKKLFDIKLVVARSLAYVLVLSFIALVYAGITTAITVLVSNDNIHLGTVLVNIVLISLSAVSFQYVKDFFTKITGDLFYKGSYEPQEVLDNLNTIVTSTINIHTLTRRSVLMLEHTMKSSFVSFVVRGDETAQRVYASAKNPKKAEPYTTFIEAKLKPHTPMVVEYIEDETLKAQLLEHKIELIIPLYANKDYIGFIVFGTKNNGVVYNQQDVKLLGIVADSLAVAVQNALRFEEIQNFNYTLQEKIDEATKKLRRANEKLKDLDETKDDFISMASHQLRTPLTSIKGYISMVVEEDAGKVNPMQKEMLTQAFFSSQRMVYLISDLLNVSRLKTGKFIIEQSPVNLVDVVNQELHQLQETAASRDLTLNFDHSDDFPQLMLDETKTRQIIMNFVDNAIYYTQAGGNIEVKLIDNRDTIELRVIDNGIGVPKAEQAHLFTKFYRAGNARKARPDGTGLGLFMAKKVIIAEGGSLIFDSVEGKGSTFGFVFSKTKLGVAPVAAKPPVKQVAKTS